MHRLLPIALLLLGALPARAQTDDPSAARARFDSAFVAWQDGDYPAALDGFARLLRSADAGRFRTRVALLTGERYRTVEVAPDGARLQWSRDGRRAAYTTNGGRTSHIVALDGRALQPLASLAGVGLTFSPDGQRVAYLVVTESAALLAARARADSLLRGQDFARYGPAMQLVARLEQEGARVVERDLASGRETEMPGGDLAKRSLAYAPDGATLYLVGAPRGEPGRSDIYALTAAGRRALTDGPGLKTGLLVAATGRHLVFSAGPATVAVLDLTSGAVGDFAGTDAALSADGTTLAFVVRDGASYVLRVHTLGDAGEPSEVRRSPFPLATPAPSPDGGRRIAFAAMPREDWEIYVVGRDGTGEVRLTREIQHDRFPRWLGPNRVLAMKGEPRHTRAYAYDASTGEGERLHHNNTVRTVAPEYEWAPSPDGTRLLISTDRDGDTITPERSLQLVTLTDEVSTGDVLARLAAMQQEESGLRERGRATFAGIEDRVRAVTEQVSVPRIYESARTLFEMDSKFITRPGNRRAIDYLAGELRRMGYQPEIQEFEPRPGVRTANVVATLRGTVDPDLIYVISSHFDSVEPGPGADDNTSGTTALLEAARVLAAHPQRATVQFAFFTGEEGGLLGSREFVRRAVESGAKIVGALNNDMVGWMNDARYDNTIRYSNPGIRDLQHAAAFLFTRLITYDAKYYRNTDAHAYYEVYGDIVGGIGSYPILGNPHYHQTHDVLETVSHQLVAEVSKTTVASIMALASSPARLGGLTLTRTGAGTRATWTAAAETGVTGYAVAYGPPSDPMRTSIAVRQPQATIPAAPGDVVSVRALGANGRTGWDWARATVPN